MATRKRADPKSEALRERRALNPRPDRITDSLFQQSEFFDARDLPQVKYEMLRRVEQEGMAVVQAARAFGFSRPSFYQAQEALEAAGLSGLLPQKRGPRGAHKLDAEVMRFVEGIRAKDASVTVPSLVSQVKKRFGIDVHRRSMERALARLEKKHP